MVSKKVGIRYITKDRYQLTVAELFVGEMNVQREMVATVHAEVCQRQAHQCPWTRKTGKRTGVISKMTK